MIMQKKNKKPGPKPFSPYTREIETLIKVTYSQLSELDKRTYAAMEALKLPRGGNSYIANLIGCSRTTIIRGIEELKKHEFTKRKAVKTMPIGTSKNRNNQFEKNNTVERTISPGR
jgi:predicted transcriptional regulator